MHKQLRVTHIFDVGFLADLDRLLVFGSFDVDRDQIAGFLKIFTNIMS